MSSGMVTSWGSGLPNSWLGIQLQSRRQAATWTIAGILLPAPYPLLFTLLPEPSPAPHLCPWNKLFSTKFVPKKLGTTALVDTPFPYLCQLLAEKAMAPHSSTPAWKIPWMEEPGRLQSMGSLRVGHDLSDFTFTFHFRAMEKEMATHSSVLAWRIPGTGEPGGLPSMGSHRVGQDCSDLAAASF